MLETDIKWMQSFRQREASRNITFQAFMALFRLPRPSKIYTPRYCWRQASTMELFRLGLNDLRLGVTMNTGKSPGVFYFVRDPCEE
jgi:hypothetical protein